MMVVVTGASGSGKSEYAEGVAVKLAGEGELYYLATMRVYGEEGVRRVERHRKLRAGKGFQTAECPVKVDEAFAQVCMSESLERTCDTSHGRVCTSEFLEQGCARLHGKIRMPVALLECMSNLVANEMFPETVGDEINANCVENIVRQIRHLKDQTGHLVIVTNQIFEDGIIYEPETMEYIRNLGQINQQLAEMADSVIEVVAGIPIFIKGEKL
jgi:Adenosyl cobinamide kinase/adenosyl cobinamide phosphate guanylyltransferase